MKLTRRTPIQPHKALTEHRAKTTDKTTEEANPAPALLGSKKTPNYLASSATKSKADSAAVAEVHVVVETAAVAADNVVAVAVDSLHEKLTRRHPSS